MRRVEDLIGRLEWAIEKKKAGQYSYLFREAISCIKAAQDEIIGVRGSLYTLRLVLKSVKREARMREPLRAQVEEVLHAAEVQHPSLDDQLPPKPTNLPPNPPPGMIMLQRSDVEALLRNLDSAAAVHRIRAAFSKENNDV